MNTEPVAIVNTNCENNIQWYDDNPKQHNGYFLYTHPVKELTDEEINDFTVKIYNCRTGAEAHEIVLAILRKANEK